MVFDLPQHMPSLYDGLKATLSGSNPGRQRREDAKMFRDRKLPPFAVRQNAMAQLLRVRGRHGLHSNRDARYQHASLVALQVL